ncbi:MAG: Rieske 2Fe-2S domain-containing protein [Deltaproteobacteria bacterium]|nr:Rieske 2Fe-2S domain-containing protein [Deltaproteobacteria bacterium]
MKTEPALEQLVDLSRREFLSHALTAAGWGSFAVVLAAGTLETLRFFFPRVLYQPPSTFRIGTPEAFLARKGEPDAYCVISIDERWKIEHRFFVVRAKDRVYALTARCTHLGCTVNWFPSLDIFKCPCHGSQYHSDGRNFAGPAPRPLDRLRITVGVSGDLVVDTSTIYGVDRSDTDDAFVALE